MKVLDGVKNALELNIYAYECVKNNIKVGMTELEVKQIIEDSYEKKSGKKINFVCDIISGERAMKIAGDPNNRKIMEGDTLILDLLPNLDGFWCDTTRTFFIGEPTINQEKAYNTVIKALEVAEKYICPNTMASDIYKNVNDVIVQNGFSKLPHHSGHCVGELNFIKPDFVEDSSELVKVNDIIALEVGIYDHIGIRVEDNYLVTQNGIECLFLYPRELSYFII